MATPHFWHPAADCSSADALRYLVLYSLFAERGHYIQVDNFYGTNFKLTGSFPWFRRARPPGSRVCVPRLCETTASWWKVVSCHAFIDDLSFSLKMSTVSTQISHKS